MRYGIDLLQPNPLEAVAHSTVPVLLIHGWDDRNISPRHSQLIAAAGPSNVALWLVPHAGHTMAWAAAPSEFERRLLGWFSSHNSHDITLSIPQQWLLSDGRLSPAEKVSTFFDLFAPTLVQVFRNLRIRNRLHPSNFPAALDSKLRPGFFTARMLVPGCLHEAGC